MSSPARSLVLEDNATFAQAVLEMGVGVEVCWPRSGQQKGIYRPSAVAATPAHEPHA